MIKQPTPTRKRVLGGSALALTLVVAGCGGGSEAPVATDVAADSVPDSAAASTSSLVAYQLALPSDDRSEPLKIGSLTLPTDDRAEPTPIGP